MLLILFAPDSACKSDPLTNHVTFLLSVSEYAWGMRVEGGCIARKGK